MAQDTVIAADNPNMDYAEHERTYAFFINLFKWGTVFCIACVLLLAFLTL